MERDAYLSNKDFFFLLGIPELNLDSYLTSKKKPVTRANLSSWASRHSDSFSDDTQILPGDFSSLALVWNLSLLWLLKVKRVTLFL